MSNRESISGDRWISLEFDIRGSEWFRRFIAEGISTVFLELGSLPRRWCDNVRNTSGEASRSSRSGGIKPQSTNKITRCNDSSGPRGQLAN